MMEWQVWCPDRGESREDAKSVRAESGPMGACTAAEIYAEKHARFSDDPFKWITLRVCGDGVDVEVEVEVEMCPNFVAGPPRSVR